MAKRPIKVFETDQPVNAISQTPNAETLTTPCETTPALPAFPISTLHDNARELFDVSLCEFDGATYNLTGEYTVPEMREIISAWLKKEVTI